MNSVAPAAAGLKSEILALVRQYRACAAPGGVEAADSLAALIEALLDADVESASGSTNHLERFEDSLKRLFGVREVTLVDSGCAANRVAVSAAASVRMGKLRLKPGDEVITVAAGSTSLASAISQNGLVPVYIDMALPAFNADVRQFQAAISSRTRAIALAHIGGNPFDLDAVTMLAAFNNLLLIEDCREAAGAAFGGRPVGCFGQFATASFHSGRQIAAGGGGAVMASSPLYRSIAEGLAQSHPAREVHAAMGIALASAFASTREERNQNAAQLSQGLSGLGDFFLLPDRLRGAQPSWIELPVLVRERAPFDRARLLAALREAGIAVRAFTSFPRIAHRKVGSLPVTQLVNERGLLVRVPPAPGQADAATIVEAFHEAVSDLR